MWKNCVMLCDGLNNPQLKQKKVNSNDVKNNKNPR